MEALASLLLFTEACCSKRKSRTICILACPEAAAEPLILHRACENDDQERHAFKWLVLGWFD